MKDRRSSGGQLRTGSSAEPVPLQTVRANELEEIRKRRHEAEVPNDGLLEENLIGLSLSGGGVRSGAFSLGVIQSLHERGLLRFIDFLSTVSGGGYAGAYLTSSALRPSVQQPAGRQRPQTNGQTAGPVRRISRGPVLEIAASENGPQPPRMLRFIYGGHYLRKTGLFFNRYTISLLLIWTLVISGLVAVASLAAFLFRKLDEPVAREWIAALGFEGDVWLAMFPSFVLLVLWVVAWAVSYFRQGAHAPGVVARFLFYLLVFSAVVAVAALLGTGDISLSRQSETLGPDAQQSSPVIGYLKEGLRAAIFAVIGASLLPYLRPSRLMQSGKSEKALEKYTFWAASRALVYGVPFVLIAIFATENISRYNEVRDPRMVRSDLSPSDWHPWSPFWRQVRAEAEEVTVPLPPGAILWDTPAAPDDLKPPKELQGSKGDSPAALSTRAGFAQVGSPDRVSRAFELLERIAAERMRVERHSLPDPEGSHESRHELEQTKLSPWTRWWAFAQLAGNLVLFEDAADYNRVAWVAESSIREKQCKDHIMKLISGVLEQPDFYTHFSREQFRTRVAHREDADREIAEFQSLLDEATRLEKESRAAGGHMKAANAGRESRPFTDQRTHAIIDVNRRLVDAWYGHPFRDRKEIFASVVLEHDQQARWSWFLWAASIFLITGLILDLNATSAHWFYGGQMALNWIDDVPGCGRRIPLSQMETTNSGYPYHLISASINLIGRRERGRSDSPRERFLFSKLYCGSEPTGYAPSSSYMDGQYTLVDAIAVSGAAVTPLLNSNPLFIALLFLGNLRLGQWIANPGNLAEQRSWFGELAGRWPYTPVRFLLGLRHPAEKRPHCFVTDGGHQENLGIEALLERRCRLIIASDAGEDGKYQFADLTKLVRWARLKHGIEIQFHRSDEDQELRSRSGQPLADIVPDEKERFSRKHFAIATIRYPAAEQDGISGPQDGYLIYLKASMTGDEPFDLLRYQASHEDFPHNSTADQFYDPERFESYRQLGFHAMDQTVAELLPAATVRADELSPAGLIARVAPPKLAEPGAAVASPGQEKASAEPQPVSHPLLPTSLERMEQLEAWLGQDAPQEAASPETWRSTVADLIGLLEHDGSIWVTKAKFWLEVIGRHDVQALRQHGLCHSAWRIQEHVGDVIRTLVQQDVPIDPETLDRLMLLAKSERAEVASAAVRALGEWYVRHQTISPRSKNSRNIRDILKRSLDPQAAEAVREAAFESVSRLKPSRIRALLKELTGDAALPGLRLASAETKHTSADNETGSK